MTDQEIERQLKAIKEATNKALAGPIFSMTRTKERSTISKNLKPMLTPPALSVTARTTSITSARSG